MSETIETDVLISGGGPVGLLIAYSLALQGVDSLLVERHDKAHQAMYGRATTLYPRTLEMFDQLGLLDELNQIGYVARNSVTYRKGKRVTSRGWHIMFQRTYGTFLDYCLNIRQKYSEDVIRGAYESLGCKPYIGWKLDNFVVDDAAKDDYKVTANVTEVSTGKSLTMRSKYIVGADGGHSLVRRLANIPFEGDQTVFKWIRIDGYFKTDMPDADVGFASIESEAHGNVLWVQLDHGVKRIGFAMTAEMLAKYGDNFTLEDAKAEAVRAMAPFSLEIESVEWWTLYGYDHVLSTLFKLRSPLTFCNIGQRVADQFFNNDRVLLAGDACHTHSSGAAQGMNTGIHDAVNLSWKLAGVVKGWYGADMLQSYDTERRPAAQYLIELDKAFSATISGQIPDKYKGHCIDANELFTKLFDETIHFNIGLGIHYDENLINKPPSATMNNAGWRAPDALVYAPGSRLPTRLFHLTKNTGVWSILVFAGQPERTKATLKTAVEDLGKLRVALPPGAVRLLTLVSQACSGGDHVFETPRAGKLYYDAERSAHTAYTISDYNGGLVVVRPDGILGFATHLDDVEGVAEYFRGFMKY